MAEPVVTQRSGTAVTRGATDAAASQPRKVEQRTNEGWAVQIGSYHEPDRRVPMRKLRLA